MATIPAPSTKKKIKKKEMADKEETKLTLKLKIVRDFFGGLFQSSKNTTLAKNVSSADEASDESFNGKSVVQKEVLLDWSTPGDESRSKGNDDSNATKDLQGTDNKDLSGLVEREVETRENIMKTVQIDEKPQSTMTLIQNSEKFDRKREMDKRENVTKTVKIDEQPQSARSWVQNRNNQNVSKGFEKPRPCKFKTEDGLWLCEVCSWSSSDITSLSFLNHCSTAEHREKMRGRFDSEQEPWGSQPHLHNLPEVKNETRESKANSQFAVWSEMKGKGEISGVKIVQKKQAQNTEQQKEKSNICNPIVIPSAEMMYKSQQGQNRVCQESSRQEGLLTSLNKGLLKEESPPVQELLELLTVSRSLSESKAQNDKKVNEMKLEVGNFKEKLFEVVKKEGVKEGSKGQVKKRKKKKDEQTKCGTNKEETNSKVSTKDTNAMCKGGGQASTQSDMDISRIEELRKWITGLGIIFIKPIEANTVRCEVCQKTVPAGSNFETMVINVGTHVEGRAHLKKLSQIVEASKAIVTLMKSIQKCSTGNLPSLI